jgi:hypothetical protein
MSAVATRPASHRCISTVHVPPRRASLIRGRRRSPRGIPTLATLGEILPCPCHPLTKGEGEGGRGGEPGGQPQVHRRRGEDPEAARGTPGRRGAVNRDVPVPLLHLHRTADFSLAADPAPLPFTDACASARGHSGEERSLLPSVKPGHRARGRNVMPRMPPRTH